MTLLKLLSDESKWCQNANASDAKGREVDPLSRSAVAWCLEGALMRCYRGEKFHQQFMRLRDVTKRSLPLFNDSHEWADVRRVIEQAGV